MDKRTKITEAAATCFLRHGFAETSLDEIVAQSGVVKQTLYNYFENKDALFKAAIDHLLANSGAEFDLTWYKLPAAEFFQKVGKLLLGILSEPNATAFLRLLVKECRRFPELQHVYAESIPKPFIEFVMGYIEKSASDKEMLAEARVLVQASAWYFRSALTGYATLSNLAPLLKYSLPARAKYLTVAADLFSRYVELANRCNWNQTKMNQAAPTNSATGTAPKSVSNSMSGSNSKSGSDSASGSDATFSPGSSPMSSSSAEAHLEDALAVRDFLIPQLGNLGEKKLAIIQGAIRVFSERGFAEASMDDIAMAAKVSKQTVYKHFQSKNFMYSFIAKCIIEQLLSKPLPANNLPLAEYLNEYCSAFVAQARQPWMREFFRLVFGESQVFPLESGTFLIYIMDHGREQLEARIRETYGDTVDSLSASIVLRSITGGFVLLSQIYVIGDSPFLSEETLASLNCNLLACICSS